MNDDNKHQQSPADPDAETQQLSDVMPAAPAEAAPRRPWLGKRNLLIGTAAAVALLAVGGSAYAIGSQAGHGEHDRAGVVQGSDGEHAGSTSDHGDSNSDNSDGDHEKNGKLAPSDAASLRAAAEKAITAAGAKGATSIDVESTGYEIEVQLADGSESDVQVATDGTTTVKGSSHDTAKAHPLLDLNTLDAIQKAALGATSSSGSVVESISTSTTTGTAYEVDIRQSSGQDSTIELATDLKVVTVDHEG